MSEALSKFVKSKAKTRATFDKKFSGSDGALSLMEMVGDAPKGVQKQAQKIFSNNADDVEKAVAEIANLAYGSAAPQKKTGIRGKTDAKPEVIEGNLPTNDTGVVADPPTQKGGRKASAAKTAKAEESVAPAKETVAAAEGDDGDLNTEIGQFVPAEGLGGVEVAGSFLPGAFDPRVQTEWLGGMPPTFSVDTDPASLRRANPMDMSLLSQSQQFDVPEPNTPAPIEPKADLSAAAPFDPSSLDMDWMTPRTDASRLDLSALFGDGTAETPTPSPSQSAPTPSAMNMSLLSGGGRQAGGPMDMSRMSDPSFQYTPQADQPPSKRPPLYDPNRSLKDWWNEPGIVSRANEFLYQRGMPSWMARSIQPTASVIDKGLKVGAPAAVGLGAGYVGLKGMQALSGASGDPAIAPPTEEEMAQTDAALAAAEARVRRMMQPPPKPASGATSAPVQ